MRKMQPQPQQPKTRNFVAIAAHQRNSAGAMEKGKRARVRSSRQGAKLALRRGDW